MKATLRYALLVLLFAVPAHAEEYKPDDQITLNLTAEDWVTTQTARVTVSVEAAVAGDAAAGARANMIKAVNDTAKSDWRLISFTRTEDQTGLERWTALFESRMPEAGLAGLHDKAKANSKAGMKLTVADIDFSPTLEEIETVNAMLRTKLLKQANDQLTGINAAVPGRGYRLAHVNFSGSGYAPQPPRMYMKTMAMDAAVSSSAPMNGPMERSQKVQMSANVVIAAIAPLTK